MRLRDADWGVAAKNTGHILAPLSTYAERRSNRRKPGEWLIHWYCCAHGAKITA